MCQEICLLLLGSPIHHCTITVFSYNHFLFLWHQLGCPLLFFTLYECCLSFFLVHLVELSILFTFSEKQTLGFTDFFFLFLALKGIHLGSFQLSFVQILSAPSSSRLLGSHNACVFSHGSFRLCSLFSIFPLCSPDWSPSLSCLQVH